MAEVLNYYGYLFITPLELGHRMAEVVDELACRPWLPNYHPFTTHYEVVDELGDLAAAHGTGLRLQPQPRP